MPIFAAFAVVASAAPGTPVPAVLGDWQGALSTGNGSLRVVLHVSADKNGKLTATLDSPDQGATGIAISAITFKDPDLNFEIERFRSSYDGKITKDHSGIKGQWKQGDASLPLTFKRVKK